MGPRDHERALAALLELGGAVGLRCSADARITAASPSVVEVLGYRPELLENDHLGRLVCPQDLAELERALGEVAGHGTDTAVTLRLRDARGTDRWFHLVVQRIGHPDHPQLQLIASPGTSPGHDDRARRFGQLLTEQALQVINAPVGSLDAALDELLAAVGRLTQVDRVSVVAYDLTAWTLTVTHEWCAPGTVPVREQERGIPLTGLEQLLDTHRSGAAYEVASVEALPSDHPLRGALERQGVRSLTTLPLRDADGCRGFVAFDVVHGRTVLGDDDRSALRLLAELVTNALARRDREQELVDSRRLLAMTGRTARLGGWSWEVDTDRITWTPELRELLGGPEAEPRSFEALLELLSPPMRRQLADAVATALVDGQPWEHDLKVATYDGRTRWIRNVGRCEQDPTGRVVRLWGAVLDVTEQLDAAERTARLAERLTATMQSVADGILLIDPDGVIGFANRRAGELLARDPTGATLDAALPGPGGQRLQAACEAAQHDDEARTTLVRFGEQGGWLEVHLYPSSEGTAVYLRDVTLRVEREQRQQAQLASERATAERLRQLDDIRSALLTAISHELRTPVTVIQGMAATLRGRRNELTQAVRHDLEDALATHADSLAELLDDLLDLDRLSRGQGEAQREVVDLGPLLAELIAGSETVDRTQLVVTAPVRVAVDPVLVRQQVRHLLSNAAKYAPDGPVEVTLSRLAGGGARIEVRDHGPGIPVEAHEQVFEPFVRLDTSHPQPGTGVGLSLVARFAELHGGRARVEQPEGGGTRMVVELPDAAG